MFCPNCGSEAPVGMIPADPPYRNFDEGQCKKCKISWQIIDDLDRFEFENEDEDEDEEIKVNEV